MLKVPLGRPGQGSRPGRAMHKGLAGIGTYGARTRLTGRGERMELLGPRSCGGLTERAGLEVPLGLEVPTTRGGRAG